MPTDPQAQFVPNRDTFATRLVAADQSDDAKLQIVAAANLLDNAQYNIHTGQRDNAYLQLELAKARIEKAMAQLQRSTC